MLQEQNNETCLISREMSYKINLITPITSLSTFTKDQSLHNLAQENENDFLIKNIVSYHQYECDHHQFKDTVPQQIIPYQNVKPQASQFSSKISIANGCMNAMDSVFYVNKEVSQRNINSLTQKPSQNNLLQFSIIDKPSQQATAQLNLKIQLPQKQEFYKSRLGSFDQFVDQSFSDKFLNQIISQEVGVEDTVDNSPPLHSRSDSTQKHEDLRAQLMQMEHDKIRLQMSSSANSNKRKLEKKSAYQLEALENEFKKNEVWDYNLKCELALTLNLTFNQVTKWNWDRKNNHLKICKRNAKRQQKIENGHAKNLKKVQKAK
eukprot:403362697